MQAFLFEIINVNSYEYFSLSDFENKSEFSGKIYQLFLSLKKG
jgi:hypothetical protein